MYSRTEKRCLYGFVASLLYAVALTASAQTVIARISITDQDMLVYVDNALEHVWKVSTARRGYKTPKGSFTPYLLHKDHISSKCHDPMPYSVFYSGNYAVHGTDEPHLLGKPVSHGCVRLQTENAKIFFELVKKYGMKNSAVVILP